MYSDYGTWEIHELRAQRWVKEGAYVGSNRVLFNQRLLGEVDLERVISRQTHRQATCKVLWEGVLVVVQEQRVVGQRAHA